MTSRRSNAGSTPSNAISAQRAPSCSSPTRGITEPWSSTWRICGRGSRSEPEACLTALARGRGPRRRQPDHAVGPRYRGRMTATIRDLPLPEAVIFDLDGTLVDTVETRIDAWLRDLRGVRPARHARPARPAHRRRWQAARPRGRRARRPAHRRRPGRGDRQAIGRDLRAAEPLPSPAARRPRARRCHREPRAVVVDRHVEPEGPGRDVGRPRSAWPASPPSSMPAMSSTPSPSPTCCSGPPRSSASTRHEPGTSATRPGTWWRRSPPG